jgi:geranylgeranyl transferase type-1 subunit beta
MSSDPPIPPLEPARHIKYFQRCLRLLPAPYTANDSSRLALAFFGLAALDLLSQATSAPAPISSPNNTSAKPSSKVSSSLPITSAERASYRAWVLSHQHPGGGFAGSPTHILPHRLRAYDGWTAGPDYKSGQWELGTPGAANIAATSFALKLLALLADPEYPADAFGGVDRAATLGWLRRLQREDGSFGEVLEEIVGPKGKQNLMIAGGRDMRYCYLAATIRWMLRGNKLNSSDEAHIEDINVDGLIAHIRRSQTYDGGVSETARNESHAGYAYCAAASLALLARPETESTAEERDQAQKSTAVEKGIADVPGLVHWLVSRQFPLTEKKEEEAADEGTVPPSLSTLTISDDPILFAGYNGRINKVADTCYAWWVAGALAILSPQLVRETNAGSETSPSLLSVEATRAFLLGKTQHIVGGFGKHVGDPPDIYHGFLGLAALSTLQGPSASTTSPENENGKTHTPLKQVDAALAVSVDAVRTIEAARSELIKRARGQTALADELLELMLKLGPEGKRPAWLDVPS